MMAVYVDESIFPYGRMMMCHMWADSLTELHTMADVIGMKRKWFQQPPKASWHHYDICKTKRALAVQHGAIQTDRYGALEYTSLGKGNFEMVQKIRDLRKRKENQL